MDYDTVYERAGRTANEEMTPVKRAAIAYHRRNIRLRLGVMLLKNKLTQVDGLEMLRTAMEYGDSRAEKCLSEAFRQAPSLFELISQEGDERGRMRRRFADRRSNDDILEVRNVSTEEAERRKLEEAKERGFYVELDD